MRHGAWCAGGWTPNHSLPHSLRSTRSGPNKAMDAWLCLCKAWGTSETLRHGVWAGAAQRGRDRSTPCGSTRPGMQTRIAALGRMRAGYSMQVTTRTIRRISLDAGGTPYQIELSTVWAVQPQEVASQPAWLFDCSLCWTIRRLCEARSNWAGPRGQLNLVRHLRARPI